MKQFIEFTLCYGKSVNFFNDIRRIMGLTLSAASNVSPNKLPSENLLRLSQLFS